MRLFKVILWLLLVGSVSTATIIAGENGTVTQSKSISFSARKTLFLSAEIVNPWTDHQVLKVVMPDNAILYRDLNSNSVWKEVADAGESKKIMTLTEVEYALIMGLELDTGWIPAGSPLQIRFIFRASNGVLTVDMSGNTQLTYDNNNVISGSTLPAQLGWKGDYYGGGISIEGGLEISCQWRACIAYWCDEGDIPYLPNIDLGFFAENNFTPFSLGKSVTCSDQVYPQDITIPVVGIPYFVSLEVGASIGGTTTGVLAGRSLCGTVAGNNRCIYSDGATQSVSIPLSGSTCNTTANVVSAYQSDVALKWGLEIGPTGCFSIPIIGYSYCFSPMTLPVTLLNMNIALPFNQPSAGFVFEGTSPALPPAPDVAVGCGYIDLDWSSISGATSYCIYRDGQLMTCLSGTSWRDTNPGTTRRCYQIAARNICGESGKSSQECGTALHVPSIPSVPNASAGCGYIDLSWSQVTGATSYCLYRDRVKMTCGYNTIWHDGNPGNSQRCYQVTAVNECGESGMSAQACATAKSAPSRPEGFAVSINPICVNKTFDLTWSIVPGATSYEIQKNGGVWNDVGNAPVYRTSISGTGSYTYSVRAKNACGSGDASAPISVTVMDCYSIAGIVYKDGNPDEPLSNFEVCLYKSGENAAYKNEYTDQSGAYNFADIPAANYTMGCSINHRIYLLEPLNANKTGLNIRQVNNIPTDADEDQNASLPCAFGLDQNLPNPFNPQTKICFAVPKTCFVTLEIYNVLGSKVRVLVSGQVSTGRHQVTWNGRDDSGNSMPSGIYLYRLAADSFVETKKMVLLK